MAFAWDEDSEASFIEAYREHACLYDKADPNFKDKDLKQQAWGAIAKKYKIEGEPASQAQTLNMHVSKALSVCTLNFSVGREGQVEKPPGQLRP